MTFDQGGFEKSMGKNTRKRMRRVLAGRQRRRWRQQYEILEDRTLLTVPTASINDVSIVLTPPGPTSVSGSLNPGNAVTTYQIDGTSGERLLFHSVSTTSTNGSWLLLGEAGNEVAGNGIASDFTANLTTTGTYYLELVGNITGEIDYSFQVSDVSDSPVPATGLGVPESGSLAGGDSATFTFTAPAGLPVYFNSLDRSFGPVSATLTDPGNKTIFSSNGSDNEGPYVLTSSGTYTLTLNNSSGSSGTFSFDMLSLPAAATSLALGPTQAVAGTLTAGTNTQVFSFEGASGEHLFLDNEQNLGDPVYYRLIGPDGNQIFDIDSYSDSGPLTLSERGTYYLLIDGESSSSINYQFRITDTAYSPLSFDTETTGSFNLAPATDAFSFAGTAGEQVTFAAFNDSNGYYGASWSLYGPNDQQLASPYYTGNFSATLPSDGNYTLVVPNNPPYGPSTYSFEAYQNVDPTTTLALGTPVSATIVDPGDEATYTFTGTAGQTLYFSANDSASGSYAQVTGPFGESILSQYIGNYYYTYEDSSQFTLPASGTYTLTISNEDDDTGLFNFLLSDTAAATPLALTSGSGTPVADSIASGLAANIYQFSGSSGEQIYFQAQNQSAGYTDLYWTLYGPANQYVDGGVYWYDFSATLPSAGTYHLVVGGTNPSNTSGVSFNFELYDNVDPTSPLTLGTPIMGTISNPGDEATFTFSGTVGQTLFFDGLNSSYNSTYVRLTTPDDTETILDQDTSYSSAPFVLPFSGAYALTVFGSGSATGPFQFVLDDASLAPSIAITPGNGETVNDSLSSGLSDNIYQLSGTTGELLYVDALSESTGNEYDLYWTLYGPNGQEVNSSYGWESNYTTLQYNGTYYLVVEGNNSANTSGLDYSFALYDNVDPTYPLDLGVPVQGTIANPGDEATYTFTGSVGQSLFFAGLDESLVAYAQLMNPSGQIIFSSQTNQSGGHFLLTEAGTYTLTVTGFGSATGTFNFELEDDSQAPFLTLEPGSGTAKTDSISTGLSTNLYQISGVAGESLYFQAQAESGATSDLEWALWAPDGESIGGNAGAWSDFSATLPAAGTYLLAVSGLNSANTTGVSYHFEVYDDVDTSSPLSPGTATSGSIAIPGDTVTYTFAGTAGQSLLLTVLSAAPGADAQIDDPGGSQIFFGFSDQDPFRLATTGTYSLTVFGDNGATGNFSFVLADVSTGTMLSPGTTPVTESGTITPGTGYAIFQFLGTSGETASLTSDSFSSTAGNWFIVDPSDNQVSSAVFGTSFTTTLSVTGTYTLVLAGSDLTDSSLAYSFDISETMPPQFTESGLPMTQSGTLDAGDSKSFTFAAPAGLLLEFNSLDRSYGPITATLTDPDNNIVFSNNASYNEGPFTLSVSGTYTLTVSSSDTSGSDPFSFVLESLADASSSLSLGSVTSGTLDPGLSTAIYSFSGTAGQNLFLVNQQNWGDPVYLSIFDPSLNEILSIGSYEDGGPLTLNASGTYYLLVDGESTGGPIDYQFQLVDTSTNPLSIGSTTSGTLSPAADADAFTFTGTAGQMLTFQFLSESNGYYGASFTLYGPNNDYVSSSYYGEVLSTTLPVGGNYTLVVTNEYYYGPSTFSFTSYQNVDSQNTLTLGMPESGTLANPGDKATYTFTGSVGQTLFLQGLDSSDGTDAQLTAPDGTSILYQYIGYEYYTYEESSLITLPESGTYTLTISNGDGDTGPYDFVLEDISGATPITLTSGAGTTVSDSIATGVSTNIYTLSGTAGERVYFRRRPSRAAITTSTGPCTGPTTSMQEAVTTGATSRRPWLPPVRIASSSTAPTRRTRPGSAITSRSTITLTPPPHSP